MEIELIKDFNKNTRYIYKVEYKTKPGESYDVITKVHYYRWDESECSYVKYWADRELFANLLYDKKFYCYAGQLVSNSLKYAVEVLAYEQSDGEHWLRTKADDTIKNNFSFIEYAKEHGFAIKVE